MPGRVATPARPVRRSEAELVHELETHRIELELQNEELRAARKVTESALDRYTDLFELAPIGYATLRSDDTIHAINRAGTELLAAPRGRLVSKRFAAHVAESSLQTFHAQIAEAQRYRTARSELDLLRSDGGTFPARVHIAVARRASPSMLVTFEDISDLRAKERELARSELALRVASRRKDEFLAALSHELRNPLAPIRTAVQVLQLAEPGSQDANVALDILDRTTHHLARLVDDLLDVTRITRGTIELHRERLELGSLVQRAVADYMPQFSAGGIEVTVTACEAWVDGDGTRLVQIASNLLGNAVKFTPRGGRVEVTVAAAGDRVQLSVKDTGIGIAPAMVGELGEPFVQAAQGLHRNRGGLGLGLAMVKTLTELHGGRLTIASVGLGRGAELTVALPLREAPARVAASSPAAVPRRRVLVIEDQLDVADSIRIALSLRGHSVEVVKTGRAGIARAALFRPEVVLCDIGLPDIDGYEVARTLRADAELRNIRLVALTGYAQPRDVARALEAGFDRHVGKPTKLDELELLLG